MSGLVVSDLVADLGAFRLGPVSLEVPAGEAVAVIGPSGAGKTTLLRSMAGFVPIGRGGLAIDGQDRATWPPERRELGFVPQGLALFPHRTVRENVDYPLGLKGLPDRSSRLISLLETWGISGLARSRPSELSGGEQQRVAMARALASAPRALLWDEPLSALDPVGRADLIEVIGSALRREGLPLVLVTHDAETAFSIAERILVLDRGRVVFRGDAAELVRRPPSTFAARFAGFENVLDPSRIRRLPDGSLGRILENHAGPGGVCFASDALAVTAPSGRGTPARIIRLRRVPSGSRIWLAVGDVELQMTVRSEENAAETLRPGTSCHVIPVEPMLRSIGPPEAQ